MNTDALRSARPKNTFTLNLNQRLNEGWGTLFFSGSQRDYWTANAKSREYQLGYSNNLGRVSYPFPLAGCATASVRKRRVITCRSACRCRCSITTPTSAPFVGDGLSLSAKYGQPERQCPESNRLSYSLSGSNRSGGDNMASVNAAYRTRVSTLGASYSEGNDYRQSGLSARGSPVAILGMCWRRTKSATP